jgi:hypothetical protein
MPRFRCLLCEESSAAQANHFCARECHPATEEHVDFCRRCRAAFIRALEPQLAASAVLEPRHDRTTE